MRARLYLAINAVARRVAVWSAKMAIRTTPDIGDSHEDAWS